MNDKMIKRISKMMSLILRHKPSTINASLDSNGWMSIDVLIKGINKKGIYIDESILETVVAENDKKRFIISTDGEKIRANQGHSIKVDIELKPIEPPEMLYHGTVDKFMDLISTEGLKKMSRQHVHLSADRETAIKVGSRRGKPIILEIEAGEMYKNGGDFFRSENGVWLTDSVAPEYIRLK